MYIAENIGSMDIYIQYRDSANPVYNRPSQTNSQFSDFDIKFIVENKALRHFLSSSIYKKQCINMQAEDQLHTCNFPIGSNCRKNIQLLIFSGKKQENVRTASKI